MPGNVREQLTLGYKKGFTELNKSRMGHWAEPVLENVNRGELAAIAFYGACVRECMSRGIDNPLHAHTLALIILDLFEIDGFEDVIYYLAGKPLPSRVTDVIEYYKANLQSDLITTMKMFKEMLNNIQSHFQNQIRVESKDDDDFDLVENEMVMKPEEVQTITQMIRNPKIYREQELFEVYHSWGRAGSHSRLTEYAREQGMVNPLTGKVSRTEPWFAVWRYAFKHPREAYPYWEAWAREYESEFISKKTPISFRTFLRQIIKLVEDKKIYRGEIVERWRAKWAEELNGK